jgi:hypothetical protein
MRIFGDESFLEVGLDKHSLGSMLTVRKRGSSEAIQASPRLRVPRQWLRKLLFRSARR